MQLSLPHWDFPPSFLVNTTDIQTEAFDWRWGISRPSIRHPPSAIPLSSRCNYSRLIGRLIGRKKHGQWTNQMTNNFAFKNLSEINSRQVDSLHSPPPPFFPSWLAANQTTRRSPRLLSYNSESDMKMEKFKEVLSFGARRRAMCCIFTIHIAETRWQDSLQKKKNKKRGGKNRCMRLVNLIAWCQDVVDDKTILRVFHPKIPKIGMGDMAALAKLNCWTSLMTVT